MKKSSERQKQSKCPSCGEAVQANWRICPVCETRLQELGCPLCGQPVKENWKRCPECEALLICPRCGRRLPIKSTACPICQEISDSETTQADQALVEEVCGIELIHVPGGTFRMGDAFGHGVANEQPVHNVTLDGFYIGRFAVTQAQWLKLMPDNPSRFEGANRPVEQVSFDDARRFIDALNQAHHGRYVFDLPTEAQWEYSARGGGKAEIYAGGNDIDAVAWYGENSQGRSHPVGKKAPNGLGLHDMSGNVWEWCRDAFLEEAYAGHAAKNPWVDLPEPDRVVRGGAYHLDAWSARCARRSSCARDFMGPALGFRVVMEKG
ncbi:MAG: SUMF1/EgtB/PvdO family nonheme iron enzyme [Desulfobacteraceae bacterium]|nr:SUMF1/EgtB/PvdO family nonheme iron enzyme [Desulfobacteraceae bacterium]